MCAPYMHSYKVTNMHIKTFTKIWKDTVDLLAKSTVHTRMKVIGVKVTVKTSATSDIGHLTKSLKEDEEEEEEEEEEEKMNKSKV